MKIPPHAIRVFKGILHDVYQWEQELFDGTKKTFEAIKRPNTLVVIPLVGDRVWYAHQEQPGMKPYISLFGGKANEGEEPVDTAKRELLEETGLISDNWQLLRKYPPLMGKVEWDVYYFVARNCRKAAEISLDPGGEKIEIHTASLEEFISEIIPTAGFAEFEIKQELLSVFNPETAEKLKNEILGLTASNTGF